MTAAKKPKVLIFIDWFSPGYKAGGPVRSMVNLIEHLVDDYDFYVVTRNSEYGETVPYNGIVSDNWVDLSENVKVWYASKGTPNVALWKRLIKETQCQVVYINGIFSPLFSLFPLIAANSLHFKRIIVAPRGMLGEGALQIKAIKKRLYLNFVKILRFYKNVEWHVTAESEREEVVKVISENAQITIIPNLGKKLNNSNSQSKINKEKGKLRICYLSRVNRKKNLLYSLDILKKIENFNSIEFHIYGPIDDAEYWDKCQKRILEFSNKINIEYKSSIKPDETNAILEDYHFLLLPTMHENFGHVILESFMAARPVIISDKTPWRNLQAKGVGWDISLDNIDDFQNVIMRLAEMEQEEFDVLCDNAFKYGKEISENVEVVNSYKQMFSLK